MLAGFGRPTAMLDVEESMKNGVPFARNGRKGKREARIAPPHSFDSFV